MTRVEERLLPGGRAFLLDAASRWRVEVVVHDDGVRELHLYPRGGHEPNASVRLDDEDARRLGAVLGGTRLRPAIPERLARRLDDLVVDWVRIDADAAVVGRSLRDLDLHRRTGMTVVALVRDGRSIVPAPSELPLEAGDRVVVVGQQRQLTNVTDVLAE